MIRRRLRDDQRGFTLVELLVVITLLSIVGAITLQAIVRTSSGSRLVQQRVAGAAELEKAMQRVVRDLRTADPLVSASTSSVQMVIYRDGGCLRQTYTAQAGGDPGQFQLVSTSERMRLVSLSAANPPCSESLGAATSSVLLRRLASPSVYAFATGGDQALSAPVAAPLQIAAVSVTFVRTLPENRPSLRLSSRVGLRNYDTLLLRSS